MKHRKIVVAIIALLVAGGASAAQLPAPAPGDKRVRFVDYDPHDVVTVYARIGQDTVFVFADDEKVLDMGGGDTDAWDVGLAKSGNAFFIKPKARSPETSVHILTDKRIYTFDMKLARKRSQPTYLTVFFRYPDQLRKLQAAQRKTQEARDLLDMERPVANVNYSVQGAEALSPVRAWDDGTATFFRFAENGVIPAIYRVDDGVESLVNVTAQPDGTLKVHTVAPRFSLRDGAGNRPRVACVWNENFARTAQPRNTNTRSPRVERQIRGASQ